MNLPKGIMIAGACRKPVVSASQQGQVARTCSLWHGAAVNGVGGSVWCAAAGNGWLHDGSNCLPPCSAGDAYLHVNITALAGNVIQLAGLVGGQLADSAFCCKEQLVASFVHTSSTLLALLMRVGSYWSVHFVQRPGNWSHQSCALLQLNCLMRVAS
eukprot:281034-Pelagomonas_calceolata.AAC.2